MGFLTDRTLATGVTLQDLIHIVITGDTSQGNPAGSSYKATIGQVFDSISGYCISDLYVTNVHGCSPITVWDDTYFLSNQILQTNTPSIYTASTATYNGFTTIFNDNKETSHIISNFDVGTDALSGVRVLGNNTGTKGGSLLYYSPGYIFPGGVNVGANFYQNKIALRALNDTDGMVINPNNGNPSGTLWFVFNGSATTKLKGNGNANTTSQLGLGLNFDGTEDPTATLQVGGTGTTASFKYVDGNQSNGYVLTSDASGNATWQTPTVTADTYTTGFTYADNTFTISDSSGNTLNATINSVTGLTVNGNLNVTGNTSLQATTASTLNISSTPTTDTNLPANYLTRDAVTGEVKVKTIPGPTVYGLFAQTGNSITVSGTTSELSIIGPGVGTLSVPTNGFSVGDSFAVRISGDLGANNGNTLTLRVKSGSVEFGVVGPITMPNVTSSHFSFEITFTIRALGTAGNAKIQSSGYFTFTQNAGGSFEGDNFSTLNDTTFDTTIPNVLDITAQFNSTNAANFIFTEILVLNKIY
jgi:hypothetical protein